MDESLQVEVVAALICDDVRKEIGGKETVVGIYIGNIIVPDFPANLLLCLWLLIKLKGSGTLKMKFRVVGTDDNHYVSFDGQADIGPGRNTGALPLPRFPVSLGKEALLRFEWQLNGSDWQTLATKEVRRQADRAVT
jgi:uncharacterized protein DUF6941